MKMLRVHEMLTLQCKFKCGWLGVRYDPGMPDHDQGIFNNGESGCTTQHGLYVI